ncbi:MAG TPA: TlyA family rRNA (cytidine-2'-O)-methyltransferase [Nitrospiraceae bacterium]|nr:MAG: RNA methyltransferase [Nitrospirae bacterium GWA2_46_11]OGW25865.1 MAG: RNA methyltransferase [Nitrospirae bacterium GWB2_47_37]HAK89236.1 TlyA family rRNA (cytidine-2'-O)-methyltransferase [Nitrospiraceae bacterium]HCL81188.1 TlyA family rRNA (cytidine-2'-O)-methyltransferase [Nitrospiraceae bacterium]HCZ11919.1 TlyA family rRNA (cytidine-2'-O)-methyltransferase [Nitrospiraceae bacterium]
MKSRLDKIIVEKGLTQSRERAQALIMEGKVFVNGMPSLKAGTMVAGDAAIELKGEDIPYVSRGGLKLEAAIKYFNISLKDKIAMDVGSSTGGFTDCMLQSGAKRVYCIDVGYGQLAWKLRQDPRVVLIERTNIRYLERKKIPDEIAIATIDVSFISLTKVVPAVLQFLKEDGDIIALIKPQFEVGKGEVGKGGIVKDEAKRMEVVEYIRGGLESLGLETIGVIQSPIAGQKGNIEFLIYMKRCL